jgi:acyl carrier protein phosphodiesterase
MNFLGHLFFSGDDTTLMAANLYGDFVKGKNFSFYHKDTQKGIKLHRAIDNYIDHHPVVIELLHQLYPVLPKVAGIAVDLYFDHVLAKNWESYHPLELGAYTKSFYKSIDYSNKDFSAKFKFMLSKMEEKNWLYQYQFPHGLYKACQGVSGRISFPNELTEGLVVFESKQSVIEEAFHLYMQEAIPYFENFRQKL